MKVIVATYKTAGDRIALAATRAMAANDCKVILASDDLSSASFASKHVGETLKLPSAILTPDTYAKKLIDAAKKMQVDVIMPTDDYAVLALANAAKNGAKFAAALPSFEALKLAQSKPDTLHLAQKIGLATPDTVTIESVQQAQKTATRLGFPVVLKIARGNGSVGLLIADTPNQIDEYFSQRSSFTDGVFDFSTLLMQNYIPGSTHDLCAVCDHGEPVAGMTSQRVFTHPRSGGVGVLVETTHDPELMEQGFRLLKAMKWHGPAQVEFKRDKSYEKPVLIEVNGRFWGSLGAAARAGVDFTWITSQLALGNPIPAQFDVVAGQQYRWPIPYVFGRARAGARRAELWQLVSPFSGAGSDIKISDPGPTFHQIKQMFKNRAASPNSLSPLDIKQSPD